MKNRKELPQSCLRIVRNILIALGAKEYMPIPGPIQTIESILTKLNSEPGGLGSLQATTTPQWVVVEGYHVITVPVVNSAGFNLTPQNPGGIVMKTFFNTHTGELRFYAAKFLDIPQADRETL